jgi:hypothetical protein
MARIRSSEARLEPVAQWVVRAIRGPEFRICEHHFATGTELGDFYITPSALNPEKGRMIGVLFGGQSFALPAFPTLPEEFERMADLRKTVLLFDFALNSFHRTRINHESHASAFSADDMVVVLLRID